MRVSTLPVMHDGYRLSTAAMRQLVDHVRAGRRLDPSALAAHGREAVPVSITRFEDGRLMLRDGLHRATAVMLGRPGGTLDASELVIEDMTYEMFLAPALEAGLYTPFDPRTEVRVADFRAFKLEVERLRTGQGDVLGYIAAHRAVYVRPRRPCHDTLAQFYAECSPYGTELG
jgi:hypothetical protein